LRSYFNQNKRIMFKTQNLIRIGWHLAAIAVLIAFACFYFSPSLDGQVLGQSDVMQAQGTQVEIKKFAAQEGREVLWTNGMFSGMPTFQIYGAGGKTYNVIASTIYQYFLLGQGVSNPVGLLFAAMIGMYLLLGSFKIERPWAILGSILYGLSTTHMILIEAGHVNKMYVLAFLPPTLAGILYLYRGDYLKGTFMTALFTCLQIMANHPQITYYFFILVAIYGIFAFVEAFLAKNLKHFFIASALAVFAGLLGVLPNTVRLWTTFDYVAECIRGKSDLKPVGNEAPKAEEGLGKDYAFDQWSLGKMESFTLLVPNFMGGDASKNFVITEQGELADDPKYRDIASVKDQNMQQEMAMAGSHYWGDQSFVSGAWYYGASVIFLFFLGFYAQKGSLKWWSLASLMLMLMISWGKNLPALNYTLFDHFPLFNKFRDPKMIIGIGHIIVIAIGFLGLSKILSDTMTKEEKNKAIIYALATVGGLTLFALMFGMFGTLEGPKDAAIRAISPGFVNALQEDRASLLTSDAWRSLFFVLLTGGVLWAYNRFSLNKWLILGGLSIITLYDVISVDKRYLSNDQFQNRSRGMDNMKKPRPVDTQIMADKEKSFRVVDFSRGGSPFSNALPSFFHNSIGGYHAAKLMIFQDVVERYLSDPQNNMAIYGMLNTKYFIVPGEKDQPIAMPIPDRCGNAWFVNSYKIVENSNEEMDSLKNLKPKTQAVIQRKFAATLEGLNIKADSTNFIRLEKNIPDDLTYKYKANGDQLAVFSEIYYPEKKGWNVYINGKKADGALIKANYLLRAVRIPSGEGVVEMKFEPDSYYKGQTYARIGSILLLLLFLATLYFSYKKENEIAE
jgi:hypothetical protein